MAVCPFLGGESREAFSGEKSERFLQTGERMEQLDVEKTIAIVAMAEH